LRRTAQWLQRPPASGSQQVADVIAVVPDAELAADDLRDAPGGPELAPKAKRFRSSGQQQRQLGQLLGRQS
jgi:hypothetical protein